MQLPAAGFTFDISQTFWLISMPALVGATLRLPYTFLVPKLGGRNWTMISAALLLIPADRARVRGEQPRDAVPGHALRRGPRGLRRRKLRELDVEHQLLLPAAGEGRRARAQRGRRQHRRRGRPDPRADRHHDRRDRGDQEHRARGVVLDPVHPHRDLRRLQVHEQPLEREGRLRGIRCGVQRPAHLDHVGALHRHLRVVHRVRRGVPEGARDPVPRLHGLPDRRGQRSRSRSSGRSSARSRVRSAASSPTGSAAPRSRSSPSR